MRSSHESYHHSSSTSRYRSPSHFSDSTPLTGGSDRAEFRDRYQNRVKRMFNFYKTILFFILFLVCMA